MKAKRLALRIADDMIISSNDSNILLLKVPAKQVELATDDIDVTKLAPIGYYRTVFAAINGAFIGRVKSSEAKNFLELENELREFAQNINDKFLELNK